MYLFSIIIIKTVVGWIKELWELLKVISEIKPAQTAASNNTRRNASHVHCSSERQSEVVRHRYIEVDGYAENLRINRQGRYDLLQIERFCENFMFVSSDAIDDFVDGFDVLWLPKDDCIEFSFHYHAALADIL